MPNLRDNRRPIIHLLLYLNILPILLLLFERIRLLFPLIHNSDLIHNYSHFREFVPHRQESRRLEDILIGEEEQYEEWAAGEDVDQPPVGGEEADECDEDLTEGPADMQEDGC